MNQVRNIGMLEKIKKQRTQAQENTKDLYWFGLTQD